MTQDQIAQRYSKYTTRPEEKKDLPNFIKIILFLIGLYILIRIIT